MSIAIWRRSGRHLGVIGRRRHLWSAVHLKNDVLCKTLWNPMSAGSILMTVGSIVLSEEFLGTKVSIEKLGLKLSKLTCITSEHDWGPRMRIGEMPRSRVLCLAS